MLSAGKEIGKCDRIEEGVSGGRDLNSAGHLEDSTKREGYAWVGSANR